MVRGCGYGHVPRLRRTRLLPCGDILTCAATYLLRGHSYAYAYRGYYYRGNPYYGYVPSCYYAPAYSGWAYNPWPAPVAYGWGWGGSSWYGYYGGTLRRLRFTHIRLVADRLSVSRESSSGV